MVGASTVYREMSTGLDASIPDFVRDTIQSIKEITGNDSEGEIYEMLRECAMDPNEAAQKLLLQDAFHEVKRKRDKKKENLTTRESRESRLRPGMQGRSRAGCSPRSSSHDAGGSRSSTFRKQNGVNEVSEKGVALSFLPNSEETINKEAPHVASSVAAMANGPTDSASGKTGPVHFSKSSSRSLKQPEVTSADVNEFGGVPPPSNATTAFGSWEAHEHPTHSYSYYLASKTSASSSAVFSSSNPLHVSPHESRLPGTVGRIKPEVGSQQTLVEPNAIALAECTVTASTSEIGSSLMWGKMPSKSQGVEKNQFIDSSQPLPSSSNGGFTVNSPLSGHNHRLQQVIGPQKVTSKEWKPKPMYPNPAQDCGTAGASEVLTMSVDADSCSHTVSSVFDSEETSTVHRKLEELHLPGRQHSDQQLVIIPNHIHVPESERTKFSFGSIDAWFGVSTSHANGPESGRTSTPSSETSQGFEDIAEGQSSSNQNALERAEKGDDTACSQSPTHAVENMSCVEGCVSSSAVPEYNDPKQETALPHGGHQYSAVHSSPSYSFGFVPPMLGTQIAPFESSDSQARDVTRFPSFVVQQPFDLTSYYAQLYRSNVDNDDHISPFHLPGVAMKYNCNVSLLPAQASHPSQEGGNSMVLSTVGPTPLVTQAAGVMHSSIAMTQQPIPVFRQPTGLHISHFPANYIPYGHYISPFYVPPSAIHQFLNNSPFPQQPQAGSICPPPPAAAATGVKYSISQYKPGTNMGNPTSIGMPSSYGSFGSAQANYNPSSAATTGNSMGNEDLAASQFKESNAYVTGQQSEGSAVWISAPARDIPGLQASTFYNLPHQGQHVSFTPTQAVHGTFGSLYHPAQTVTATTVHPLLQQSQTIAGAADMGGPTANAFQRPQHAQINWPSSY